MVIGRASGHDACSPPGATIAPQGEDGKEAVGLSAVFEEGYKAAVLSPSFSQLAPFFYNPFSHLLPPLGFFQKLYLLPALMAVTRRSQHPHAHQLRSRGLRPTLALSSPPSWRSNRTPKRPRRIQAQQSYQRSRQATPGEEAQPPLQSSCCAAQSNISPGVDRVMMPMIDRDPEPEEIGIPSGGFYEIDSVIKVRSCVDHWKDWLLCFKDRWMTPADFKIGSRAQEKLEAKLQGAQAEGTRMRLKPSDCADCLSSVWARIDVPLAYRRIRGQDCFLIRWKPTWVPEDKIADLNEVEDSYRKRELGCRKSSRNIKFNERKWEDRMRVFYLEQFLDE